MDDDVVWRPAPDAFARSNAGRLARRLGVEGGHDALYAASIADLARFWDTVVQDLELPFDGPTGRCSTSRAARSGRAGSSAAA